MTPSGIEPAKNVEGTARFFEKLVHPCATEVQELLVPDAVVFPGTILG